MIADPKSGPLCSGRKGKAFVAGADIEFLINNIESGDIPRIARYSQSGHQLMNLIDSAASPSWRVSMARRSAAGWNWPWPATRSWRRKAHV